MGVLFRFGYPGSGHLEAVFPDVTERAVALAPVGEVGGKEALEDLAVVGRQKMNELVHHDVLC